MKYTYNNISEERLASGKQKVRDSGGTFYKDGSFEVSGVEGNYRYEDGSLTITITDKPWLASWGMIKDKLNAFFSR